MADSDDTRENLLSKDENIVPITDESEPKKSQPEEVKPAPDSLLQKTQKGLKPYQIFLLAFLPIVRATYVVNKNSLGYCFGYQGEGAQATA